MRDHGCTVIGRSVREAVYTAVCLEVNAGLHRAIPAVRRRRIICQSE